MRTCANDVAGVTYRHVGWRPGCTCKRESPIPFEPVPCRVLDPFGGSGTTPQVAEYLNRDWLMCELNPQYASLAYQRIRTVPRFRRSEQQKTRAMPTQASLF